MSTKKIQITTPIVTSVNGSTGDVTIDTAVQPDWSQNDETAKDYVKNRPGGYDKQVSINIDKDITEGSTGVISNNGYYYVLLPEIEEINDLIYAKIGPSDDTAVHISGMREYSESIGTEAYNKGARAFYLYNDANLVCYAVLYSPEDNTAFGDSVVLNKGYYIEYTNTHLYIYNNSLVPFAIAKRYLSLDSISEEIDVIGGNISFNCKWGSNITTYFDQDGKKVIQPKSYTAGTGIAISNKNVISSIYKAGNGISISNDGTISVTTATYYSGTSTPANTLGADGDLYLQTEG